jgi:hypothetical protein
MTAIRTPQQRLSNRFDLFSRRRHAASWRRAAFNGLREFSITPTATVPGQELS